MMLTAFSVHKFYMGIYQVNYAPDKKMLQLHLEYLLMI
jgi:hypothetical protein